MAAPAGPRAEAGAPAAPSVPGESNRKNAENQLAEKKAGNRGSATADSTAANSADRPGIDKLGGEPAVPEKPSVEKSGAEKSGTVTKSLADPMTRGMKPQAAATKDEQPLGRDALPEAKPAVDGRLDANRPQNQVADGQLREQKAQAVADAKQNSKELRQLQIPQELLGQPALLVARQHGLQV
jgi:hypothetical protein